MILIGIIFVVLFALVSKKLQKVVVHFGPSRILIPAFDYEREDL